MGEDLGVRISLLEERVDRLETEVAKMSSKLDAVATKEDLIALRQYIEQRDAQYTAYLWRLIFGLTTIIAILAGVRQLIEIFTGL